MKIGLIVQMGQAERIINEILFGGFTQNNE